MLARIFSFGWNKEVLALSFFMFLSVGTRFTLNGIKKYLTCHFFNVFVCWHPFSFEWNKEILVIFYVFVCWHPFSFEWNKEVFDFSFLFLSVAVMSVAYIMFLFLSL